MPNSDRSCTDCIAYNFKAPKEVNEIVFDHQVKLRKAGKRVNKYQALINLIKEFAEMKQQTVKS